MADGERKERLLDEVPDAQAASSLVVSAEAGGMRLDAYLASRVNGVSRSALQRAIASGAVLVNDQVAKASYKVRAGDELQVELPETIPLEAAPEAIPLDIVYEDAELIVVNKPAGMVVHPGAGVRSGTLANALVYHFNQLSRAPGALRPGIVHRLDVGTSGLIVIAKTDLAHQNLAAQFESRTVYKRYRALVHGHLAANAGRIDAPIGRDPRNRIRMAVRPPGHGRTALTLYHVAERLDVGDKFSLLDVEIKTGRTHQIRVHLAYLKHPIVADEAYDGGRGKTLRTPPVRAALARLGRPFLHAAELRFTHPATGEALSFGAPLPDDLRGLLALLRDPQRLQGG